MNNSTENYSGNLTTELEGDAGTVAMCPAAGPNDPGCVVYENIGVVSGSGELQTHLVQFASGVAPPTPTCTEVGTDTFSDFTVDPQYPQVPIAVSYGPGQFQIPFPTVDEVDNNVTTWTPSANAQSCPSSSSSSGPYSNGGNAVCSVTAAPNDTVQVADLTHISGTCANDVSDPNGFDFDDESITYNLTLSPTADSDGDGCSDVDELAAGTNPVDASSHPQSCSDADVALAVDDPGSQTEGSPFNINSTVTNNGPDQADGVNVNFAFNGVPVTASNLPSGCVNPGGAGIVSCDLGSLGSGASLPIKFTLTPTGSGTLAASGAVSSSTPDPVLSNNSWSENIPVALSNSCVPLPPPPLALFTWSHSPSRSVSFDGSASSALAGITSYTWSFGDGATSSGPLVSHTYRSVGQRSVQLTVTDACGQTTHLVQVVQVGNRPPRIPNRTINVSHVVNTTQPAITLNLLQGVSDPDGDSVSLLGIGNNGCPGGELIALDPGTGQAVFQPPSSNWIGTCTFDIEVEDSFGATSSGTLTFHSSECNSDSIHYQKDDGENSNIVLQQLVQNFSYCYDGTNVSIKQNTAKALAPTRQELVSLLFDFLPIPVDFEQHASQSRSGSTQITADYSDGYCLTIPASAVGGKAVKTVEIALGKLLGSTFAKALVDKALDVRTAACLTDMTVHSVVDLDPDGSHHVTFTAQRSGLGSLTVISDEIVPAHTLDPPSPWSGRFTCARGQVCSQDP